MQIVEFYSFLIENNIPLCICIPHSLSDPLVLDTLVLSLFWILWTLWLWVCSVWYIMSMSFWCVPRVALLDHMVIHPVFHSGRCAFPSPVCFPCRYLFTSVFCTKPIWQMRRYSIVILIYIPLMASNVEHFLTYMLAIFISPSVYWGPLSISLFSSSSSFYLFIFYLKDWFTLKMMVNAKAELN